MRIISALATLLVVIGSLLSFHARTQKKTGPASQQVLLKKGDRIIFFGDSLAALAVKD